jgi:hypothetical protein
MKVADAKTVDNAARWTHFLNTLLCKRIVLSNVRANKHWDAGGGTVKPVMSYESNLLHWEDGRLVAGFRLDIKLQLQETNQAASEFHFEYILDYSFDPKPKFERELGEVFARRNAPFHAWPFVRERLISLSQDMEFPPVMLPPLIVGPASSSIPQAEDGKPERLSKKRKKKASRVSRNKRVASTHRAGKKRKARMLT